MLRSDRRRNSLGITNLVKIYCYACLCRYFSLVASPPRICRSDLAGKGIHDNRNRNCKAFFHIMSDTEYSLSDLLISSTFLASDASTGFICVSLSVTSLCTVLLLIPNCFAVCLTVEESGNAMYIVRFTRIVSAWNKSDRWSPKALFLPEVPIVCMIRTQLFAETVSAASADLRDKIAEHCHTLCCMHDFRVELDCKQSFFRTLHAGNRAYRCMRRNTKAFRILWGSPVLYQRGTNQTHEAQRHYFYRRSQ